MSYALSRTSMALDQATMEALKELTVRWGVSRTEVMRRAVRKAKEESDREESLPRPLEALDWLQNGGGLTIQEAADFREQVRSERLSQTGWWEA